MEISDSLECLFTSQIREKDDSFQIQVPDREIDLGGITPGDTYRVAIMTPQTETKTATDSTAVNTVDTESSSNDGSENTNQEPPVEAGETRTVEIDSIGDQGDGIARVDRGYVLIIPDTEVGDRVTARIENTTKNVAFAEVVDHHHHQPQHD